MHIQREREEIERESTVRVPIDYPLEGGDEIDDENLDSAAPSQSSFLTVVVVCDENG